MKTRRIGNTELNVSAIGLGCNNFGPMIGKGLDEATSKAVVHAALDVGITFFDTAERYAGGVSEYHLGKALSGRRDGVVVATKFGNRLDASDTERAGTAAYINSAIDGSLRRLGMDHVDLYYYHRPDGGTPVAETLAALDDVVRSGKARYVACSNFDAALLADADAAARGSGTVRFAAVQNEYNLLQRDAENDVLPLCRELDVGFVPFYPLANGLLTGKYRAGEAAPVGTRLALPDRAGHLEAAPFERIEALTAFAESRGHRLIELAIAGLAAYPGVSSVIAGATSAEQVRANAAAGDWTLDASELAELASI